MSYTIDEIRTLPLDDKLPSAAALLPWTSELAESVRGIKTSQIPISSNCPFSSSDTKQIRILKKFIGIQERTTQSQDSDTSSHLALDIHGNL